MSTADPAEAPSDPPDVLPSCWGVDGDWTDIAHRVTYPARSKLLELAVQLARPIRGHSIEFGSGRATPSRVIRDELWPFWIDVPNAAHRYDSTTVDVISERADVSRATVFTTSPARRTSSSSGSRSVEPRCRRRLPP